MAWDSLSSRGSTALAGALPPDGLVPTLEIVASINDATYLNGANSVDVANGLAVVAAYAPGGTSYVTVLDVHDPTNPVILGHLTDAGLAGTRYVQLSGGLAYVCSTLGNGTQGGLYIIDYATKPTAPTIVGSILRTEIFGAHRLVVDGPTCYITASGVGGTVPVLAAFDISTPTAPRFLSALASGGDFDDPFGMLVDGKIALVVGSSSNSVAVVDVSNPAAMTIRSVVADAVNLGLGHNIVAVGGGKAIMTLSGTDGIASLDYSNPDAIARISTLADSSSMNGAHHLVPLGRKFLMVAAQVGDGMAMVNIEDLAAMYVVQSISDPLLDGTRGLAVSGRTWMAGSYFGNNFVVGDFGAMSAPVADLGQVKMGDASASRFKAGRVEVVDGLIVGQGGITSRGPIAGPSGLTTVVDEFEINALTKSASNVNWSTFTQSSTRFNGFERASTTAQDCEVVFKLPNTLRAGTWTLALAYMQAADSGIFTISVSPDATTWTDIDSSIDSYLVSGGVATRSEAAGLVIAASMQYLRLKMHTKNASATGYKGRISGIYGVRTGA